MCAARRLSPKIVSIIRHMHRDKYLRDGEIGERLELHWMIVWHARQYHDINRHNPATDIA